MNISQFVFVVYLLVEYPSFQNAKRPFAVELKLKATVDTSGSFSQYSVLVVLVSDNDIRVRVSVGILSYP